MEQIKAKLKSWLVLVLLFASISSYGQSYNFTQDLPVKNGKLVYEKIVEGMDVKKPLLYASAKKWMADVLKNTGPVLQTEDLTTGQLIGKAFLDVENRSSLVNSLEGYPIYKFSVQLDVRDGKYRMRIYDILLNIQPRAGEELTASLDSLLLKSAPITGKTRIEKAKATSSELNSIFRGLLNSFNDIIKEAKLDDF
ncbi:DUF4468 domain-containing protein [Pedobacter rhizosphaerae]|uniref:DUF4468 domain-containing protein n=1 Tax=Pedobacter rhizosphaerae TaxID=390241 RepID=A0A1H9QQT9_9SPHI|nr:DUF4468 domain-containing protein [Pedobacter rhizosphaerae]SER62876.1 protein of unknown function [Pedobacter rhizosphaerae]